MVHQRSGIRRQHKYNCLASQKSILTRSMHAYDASRRSKRSLVPRSHPAHASGVIEGSGFETWVLTGNYLEACRSLIHSLSFHSFRDSHVTQEQYLFTQQLHQRKTYEGKLDWPHCDKFQTSLNNALWTTSEPIRLIVLNFASEKYTDMKMLGKRLAAKQLVDKKTLYSVVASDHVWHYDYQKWRTRLDGQQCLLYDQQHHDSVPCKSGSKMTCFQANQSFDRK